MRKMFQILMFAFVGIIAILIGFVSPASAAELTRGQCVASVASSGNPELASEQSPGQTGTGSYVVLKDGTVITAGNFQGWQGCPK